LKRVGVEKARTRLSEAFRNHELLKSASDYADFEVRWGAFLTSLNCAFEILRQSAKGNDKSYNWISKLVYERKRDALLCYLWHARNANDHGVDHVVEKRAGGFSIPVPASGALYIENMKIEDGKITEFKGHGYGSPVNIVVLPDGVFLEPVVDRGQEYPPPLEHLGAKLEDKTPLGVAFAALQYYALKFGEAESLTL
jgi:hypothetical protein